MLRSILQELEQLREEQRAERERTQVEMRRLEQLSQISRSNFISDSGSRAGSPVSRSEVRESGSVNSLNLGYKLKPDTYDGTGSLGEFFVQFDLIANANSWTDSARTVALVSCLRGKARSVLECISKFERLDYSELKSKLELRFGDDHSLQSYYSQFTNRKQKIGEDEASLGSEIERLFRLAYPECTHQIRDKIACAQFISALSNNAVKKTLQLEGVSSLKVAIQRAKAVRAILESGHERPHFFESKKIDYVKKNSGSDFSKKGNGGQQKGRVFPVQKPRSSKECWHCGDTGHFRAECPAFKGLAKEN